MVVKTLILRPWTWGVLALFPFLLRAQAGETNAPCARILFGLAQDSVTWQGQPCAGFGGYVVQGRLNNSGPWQNLDTLPSPSASGYLHNNPGERFWAYRIGQICNGSLDALSLVVFNERPRTPDLRQVSILNNVPVVSWYRSSSPGVIGYQLYKEQPYGSGNFFPYPRIDQLVTDTFFVDAASPSLQVRYALVAVTPCNKGLLGEGGIDSTTGPHTSIFMQANFDACRRSIALSWNAYENWRLGLQRYEIWQSRNGGPFQLLDSTSQTNYTLNEVRNGDSLTFYIQAIERGQENNAARSNLWAQRLVVNRPMDYLRLTRISVEPNGMALEWLWDTDTDFASASLERSADGQNYQAIQPLNLNQLSYLDPNIGQEPQTWYYRLRSLDACGDEAISPLAHSLTLLGQSQTGFENALNWNLWDWAQGRVEFYRLYRVNPAGDELLGRFSASERNFIDRLDLRRPEQARSCYRLDAQLFIPAEIGQGSSSQSLIRSNTFCLEQQSLLHFPNAFAPEGINRVFKPATAFGSTLQDYQLQIYNRYGQRLFETNNPNEGWDGYVNGQLSAQGVYIYQVRYKQADGQSQSLQGTLMLIR